MTATSRVVVTGGSGFIGSHLCDRLQDEGYQVTILDSKMGYDCRSCRPRDFDGAEVVFHLAAKNSATAEFYSDPAGVLDTGVRSAQSVIWAAGAANVPHLIVASSSEVYGDARVIPTPETEPMRIADPTNPRFSYATSKIFTEVAAFANWKAFQSAKVLRPFNVFGPGQGLGHVVPDLIAKAKAGGEFIVEGNGDDRRAFCWVEDAIDAIMLVWKRGESGIYNIGNESYATISELAQLIAPDRPITYTDAHRAGSPTYRCPDITKTRSLGYAPKITLPEGIARLMAS